MDRYSRRVRTGESSSRAAGDVTRLTDLPTDALSEVAKGLTPDNPREAAINLAHFSITSHAVQSEFARGNAAQFETRLNRLGTSFATLSEKALPELPDGTPEANFNFACRQLPAIHPLLKFYEANAQTAIVDHVVHNDNKWDKAAAAAALSTNLADFYHDHDRRRIIDLALASFADDEPVVRNNGARALIRGHDHLNAADKAQLAAIFDHTPELVPLFNQLTQEQQEWFRSQAVQPQRSVDRSIHAIEAQVEGLPAGVGSLEQAKAMHDVAKSITETYDRARAEFISCGRSRERSSSGR
ncbi:hypothetical protein [Sinorhizobium meliloti]|uniref:hypothetical protein n=1 Tax=Rhizobium meliloti TaxID=382 RepID=UPI00208FFED9|nr:hypothetical protein [Sinorhizobium meliloti]MCO5966705.1 hypothetical protein [Sinorhizobium meliloti]